MTTEVEASAGRELRQVSQFTVQTRGRLVDGSKYSKAERDSGTGKVTFFFAVVPLLDETWGDVQEVTF